MFRSESCSRIEPRWDRVHRGADRGLPRAASRVSACRKNFSMGSTSCCATRPTLIPLDAPPVILTGEYIPENFLLSRDSAGWRLSGLIDFGDVMTGWGEYDLLGPSAFMTAGMPRRVRSLFEGFGYSRADIDADPEAAADGADAAASRQRSDPPHLYRGLAAEGRRSRSNCRNCFGRSEDVRRSVASRNEALEISAYYISKYVSLYAM